MSINHAGMVRITEPHFGKLLIFLMIEIIKDIFTFFMATGKSFVQWMFRWRRRK